MLTQSAVELGLAFFVDLVTMDEPQAENASGGGQKPPSANTYFSMSLFHLCQLSHMQVYHFVLQAVVCTRTVTGDRQTW